MIRSFAGLPTQPQSAALELHCHRRRQAADGADALMGHGFIAILLTVVMTLGVETSTVLAQGTKVPVLGKLSSQGSAQAFSGKLESLDLKRNLLKVNTVQGGYTEIFQVKKDVSVHTAAGEKLKPSELTRGTNILVYFELKSERRRAKEIIVLADAPAEEQKIPPPS